MGSIRSISHPRKPHRYARLAVHFLADLIICTLPGAWFVSLIRASPSLPSSKLLGGFTRNGLLENGQKSQASSCPPPADIQGPFSALFHTACRFSAIFASLHVDHFNESTHTDQSEGEIMRGAVFCIQLFSNTITGIRQCPAWASTSIIRLTQKKPQKNKKNQGKPKRK